MSLPDFVEVKKCPRCEEPHQGLAYRPMDNGPKLMDTRAANYWAFCPVKGQPLLLFLLRPSLGPPELWTF